MSFAVCENQLEVAAFLLEQGASPVSSGTPDTLLQIARDRGYSEIQQLLGKRLEGKRVRQREQSLPKPSATGTSKKWRLCLMNLLNSCMGSNDPST